MNLFILLLIFTTDSKKHENISLQFTSLYMEIICERKKALCSQSTKIGYMSLSRDNNKLLIVSLIASQISHFFLVFCLANFDLDTQSNY